MSFKNYGSIHEAGLDAVLWASAIEVLASPPSRNVERMDGLNLIGKFPWQSDRRLRARRYRVRDKKRPVQVNFAQRAYDHLHKARSKFVHGDKISGDLLNPFGRNSVSLLSLASTLYRLALIAYLEQHWPWPRSIKDLDSLDLRRYVTYGKHLLGAMDGVDPEA